MAAAGGTLVLFFPGHLGRNYGRPSGIFLAFEGVNPYCIGKIFRDPLGMPEKEIF
jgi:hypothetical protein